MINKRCPNSECGSMNTYAVPSRAKNKVDSDGKYVADENGLAIKVMCRRCRNCGEDYYDEQHPRRAPTETEQKMLEAVRKYRDEKEKKKLQ
jgi:hypothetical protein